ncbi:MAG: DUF296 domain-containing protein [Deltaproteobacteria bacterium]|nr:DUF296 domain-containing protein [Deltaproteobacteria bacterium]
MLIQTSEVFRHLVGRLERGEGVLELLAAAAKANGVRVATVTVAGLVDQATLVTYDPRTRAFQNPRRFEGPLEVLARGSVGFLNNSMVVHLHATVSRETDRGMEVLGGRLAAARAVAVEFDLTVFDDLNYELAEDQTTGLVLWRARETQGTPREGLRVPMVERIAAAAPAAPPPPPPPPLGPAPRTLPEVAQALEAMPRKPERETRDEPDEPEIVVGDLLLHDKFGLCEVLKIPEPDRVDVRPQSGPPRTLSLGIFSVAEAPPRDGRRVLKLVPRRR